MLLLSACPTADEQFMDERAFLLNSIQQL